MTLLMRLMLHPEILLLALFLSVLLAVEVGRIYGWRRGDRLKADTPGANSLNGAVFALLGLFIAFSFSGAAARYDARRQLIIAEINSVSTVAARIALAPPAVQPDLRATLNRYVKARIATDQPVKRIEDFVGLLRQANAVQAELWTQAVAAGKRPDAASTVNFMLLPAVNALGDASSNLSYTSLIHPPPIIHYLLVILAWTAAFLAGIGLSTHHQRSWVHAINFAAIVSAVIFITIDLEYPRAGFIRTDGFENSVEALSNLR